MDNIFLVYIGDSVEKVFESLILARGFVFEELTRPSETGRQNYWTSKLAKHDQTILNMIFEKQLKQLFIDHYNRAASEDNHFCIQEIEVQRSLNNVND